MGGIWGSFKQFENNFIEIIGFKAGIILTHDKLCSILSEYDEEFAIRMKMGDGGTRLHSSEFEEIIGFLLYKVGNTDEPDQRFQTVKLYHSIKHNPALLEMYLDIMGMYNKWARRALNEITPNTKALDPTDFMTEATKKYGKQGLDMSFDIIKGTNKQLHASPWGRIRSIDWKDEVELVELFESEKLETLHGSFFDQRFIDYLERNYDDIGNINWRKFEGFTAEYFEREGFLVDVGPGRNDDGIDLRIYPKQNLVAAPPLIIVQCKRQKAKIGKALIKSVYADVVHERASSGLIVTSSYISPGAEKMNTARGYPITSADRDTLETWIQKMKTDRL